MDSSSPLNSDIDGKSYNDQLLGAINYQFAPCFVRKCDNSYKNCNKNSVTAAFIEFPKNIFRDNLHRLIPSWALTKQIT